MIYQMRFQAPDTLKGWVETTSRHLLHVIPAKDWPESAPPAGARTDLLVKALKRGLKSVLTRRSLCESWAFCDEGCNPVSKNLNSKRYLDIRAARPVTVYLVENIRGPSELVEKIIDAVRKEFREFPVPSWKTRRVLKRALFYRLYENIFCGREKLCEHSVKVEMPGDSEWEKPSSGREAI